MNDTSNASRGNLGDSIEIKRASSASSEENGPPSASATAIKQIPSPRPDRYFIVSHIELTNNSFIILALSRGSRRILFCYI